MKPSETFSTKLSWRGVEVWVGVAMLHGLLPLTAIASPHGTPQQRSRAFCDIIDLDSRSDLYYIIAMLSNAHSTASVPLLCNLSTKGETSVVRGPSRVPQTRSRADVPNINQWCVPRDTSEAKRPEPETWKLRVADSIPRLPRYWKRAQAHTPFFNLALNGARDARHKDRRPAHVVPG